MSGPSFYLVEGKVATERTSHLTEETSLQKRSGMARFVEEFQFYLHTHAFIHEWNEQYLPLPFLSSFTDLEG